MRDAGDARSARVSICSFRPFPLAALREALEHAKRVVVLEKCLAVGLGGIVSDGVRKALSGIQLKGYTVIAGLGGRAITRASLRQLFEDAGADELEQVTFLDLNADVVSHELERETSSRAAPAPPPKRSCAASAPSARRSAERRRHESSHAACRPSSSTRPAPSPSATGCSPRTSARCRPNMQRTNSLNSGPPRLPGLRRGARRALRDRRGDARDEEPADRRQRDRLPRGVLDAVSGDVVADPVDPLAVRQRRRGRLGRRRGAAGQGPAPTSASSRRAATAAPPTSASAACPGCSSATTTCSTSATTTRPT